MTVAEFNLCVEQHADAVYRFIRKNIRDEEKAKDIVQDAFEKMWMKVSNIEAGKAKSYLFTTAYRNMIDKLRREKFETQLEESHDREQVHHSVPDLKKLLDKALEKLSEIQRSVILLRDYEGYRDRKSTRLNSSH